MTRQAKEAMAALCNNKVDPNAVDVQDDGVAHKTEVPDMAASPDLAGIDLNLVPEETEERNPAALNTRSA